MKKLLLLLLISSCTKTDTCWHCDSMSVAGVHYNDTTICGGVPVQTDINGNNITRVCH